MKLVFIYYLPNEQAYIEDFAWRMSVGIGMGDMLPYENEVGDCQMRVTVDCEEHLLMMKLRHPRARIENFGYYGAGTLNEDEG